MMHGPINIKEIQVQHVKLRTASPSMQWLKYHNSTKRKADKHKMIKPQLSDIKTTW